MKKSLLLMLLYVFTLTLYAQKDSVNVIGTRYQKDILRDASDIVVSIYPVPVRENSFTIKTNRDISYIKITNIIGQDIFRVQYSNPQQLSSILLDHPKRGMYLVAIIFSDGARIVKKIMVEESE